MFLIERKVVRRKISDECRRRFFLSLPGGYQQDIIHLKNVLINVFAIHDATTRPRQIPRVNCLISQAL